MWGEEHWAELATVGTGIVTAPSCVCGRHDQWIKHIQEARAHQLVRAGTTDEAPCFSAYRRVRNPQMRTGQSIKRESGVRRQEGQAEAGSKLSKPPVIPRWHFLPCVTDLWKGIH